ncbi:hypothetical protein CCR75_007576 [Bremia lactucae]|uniref:S-adenosyl-L-methionine-dependent methyltransferase n=1 Tax=Bremia lactucae TaxID=4779 RepID=A0A976IAV1_BRELC|nr:hypothetical protein CCR75_007576 [Bremia lactucae]
MEQATERAPVVSEPIDALPSSFVSSKMQSEDFAQFMSFMDAYLRAVEDVREDRLIHDFFAEPLTCQVAAQLSPRLHKWKQKHPHPENYVALRGRYLDDALLQRDPSIRQIVLLGAGLDTRAFRLQSLVGCHVFEIDQSAELFKHKQTVLEKLEPTLLADRHDYVVADLNAFNWEEGLLYNGFKPELPTFWVLEGITMYLTQASNIALLKTIDVLSAPGSKVWGDTAGCGIMHEGGLFLFKVVSELYQKELGKQLFQHTEDNVCEGIFNELPWEIELQADLGEPGIHFGREWDPVLTQITQVPVVFQFVLVTKGLAT